MSADVEGPAVPLLTVRGGSPTAEELAALTVVLGLLAGGPEPAPAPSPFSTGRPRPQRSVRRPARRPGAQAPLLPDNRPHPEDPR